MIKKAPANEQRGNMNFGQNKRIRRKRNPRIQLASTRTVFTCHDKVTGELIRMLQDDGGRSAWSGELGKGR